MRLIQWFLGLAVASAMGLTLIAPAAQAATEVQLFARLHGSASFSRATGSSEYERTTRQRDVEVTVNNIARLAGKRVTVYVNLKKVGTILVSSTGRAHREWSTEHGQSVPFASAGNPVRVRTASGTLVASGTYHRADN
jgi:hypothetical protein